MIASDRPYWPPTEFSEPPHDPGLHMDLLPQMELVSEFTMAAEDALPTAGYSAIAFQFFGDGWGEGGGEVTFQIEVATNKEETCFVEAAIMPVHIIENDGDYTEIVVQNIDNLAAFIRVNVTVNLGNNSSVIARCVVNFLGPPETSIRADDRNENLFFDGAAQDPDESHPKKEPTNEEEQRLLSNEEDKPRFFGESPPGCICDKIICSTDPVLVRLTALGLTSFEGTQQTDCMSVPADKESGEFPKVYLAVPLLGQDEDVTAEITLSNHAGVIGSWQRISRNLAEHPSESLQRGGAEERFTSRTYTVNCNTILYFALQPQLSNGSTGAVMLFTVKLGNLECKKEIAVFKPEPNYYDSQVVSECCVIFPKEPQPLLERTFNSTSHISRKWKTLEGHTYRKRSAKRSSMHVVSVRPYSPLPFAYYEWRIMENVVKCPKRKGIGTLITAEYRLSAHGAKTLQELSDEEKRRQIQGGPIDEQNEKDQSDESDEGTRLPIVKQDFGMWLDETLCHTVTARAVGYCENGDLDQSAIDAQSESINNALVEFNVNTEPSESSTRQNYYKQKELEKANGRDNKQPHGERTVFIEGMNALVSISVDASLEFAPLFVYADCCCVYVSAVRITIDVTIDLPSIHTSKATPSQRRAAVERVLGDNVTSGEWDDQDPVLTEVAVFALRSDVGAFLDSAEMKEFVNSALEPTETSNSDGLPLCLPVDEERCGKIAESLDRDVKLNKSIKGEGSLLDKLESNLADNFARRTKSGRRTTKIDRNCDYTNKHFLSASDLQSNMDSGSYLVKQWDHDFLRLKERFRLASRSFSSTAKLLRDISEDHPGNVWLRCMASRYKRLNMLWKMMAGGKKRKVVSSLLSRIGVIRGADLTTFKGLASLVGTSVASHYFGKRVAGYILGRLGKMQTFAEKIESREDIEIGLNSVADTIKGVYLKATEALPFGIALTVGIPVPESETDELRHGVWGKWLDAAKSCGSKTVYLEVEGTKFDVVGNACLSNRFGGWQSCCVAMEEAFQRSIYEAMVDGTIVPSTAEKTGKLTELPYSSTVENTLNFMTLLSLASHVGIIRVNDSLLNTGLHNRKAAPIGSTYIGSGKYAKASPIHETSSFRLPGLVRDPLILDKDFDRLKPFSGVQADYYGLVESLETIVQEEFRLTTGNERSHGTTVFEAWDSVINGIQYGERDYRGLAETSPDNSLLLAEGRQICCEPIVEIKGPRRLIVDVDGGDDIPLLPSYAIPANLQRQFARGMYQHASKAAQEKAKKELGFASKEDEAWFNAFGAHYIGQR